MLSIWRVALALGVGTAGGLLFLLLHLPLPWMLGSMLANAVAALSGAPVRLPPWLRTVCVVVIGVMIGSAFNPALLSRIPGWLGGVGVLALYAPLATVASYYYFRRLGKFDPIDSFFASAPGGLNEMVMVGEAMGGDPRRIALVHASRVMVVVLAIPFYFRNVSGQYSEAARLAGDRLPLTMEDALILTLAGVAGAILGKLARLPASQILGPMAISAAVHLAGFTASRPPAELIAAAQIVMGSAIGCRFAGTRLHEIRRVMLFGAANRLCHLVATVAFTLAFKDIVAVQSAALALSLVPGGVIEMSLVALALSVDAAFVSCMHILRIGMVVVCMPLAFRLGFRRTKR
jgi:membrane AbrB-like protein